MRIGIISDTLLEAAARRANLVPDPMIKTQVAFTMARAIMAAVEIGVFDALVANPGTVEDVAAACETRMGPTRRLLNAMVTCEYLRLTDGRYALTAVSRKWLTRSSPDSLCDKMLLQNLEWEYLTQLVPHLRDGTSVDLHQTHDPDVWRSYQRGMADVGRPAVAEVVRRAPIPKSARAMLDIGGSGGTYAAAFVKSRPNLSALILDLPAAMAEARAMVESHGLGADRLAIRAGDVLTDDLGQARYDFVFMGNVAHHLSDAGNRVVAGKVAAALEPEGVFCVLEMVRTDEPSKGSQFGSLLDLYFGLTSQSGTWSVAEVTSWLTGAGLTPGKPVWLRTVPGIALIHGSKVASGAGSTVARRVGKRGVLAQV